MSDYSTTELGPTEEWHALEGPKGSTGKVFVDGLIGSQNSGMSVNGLAPGQSSPFWHKHSQIEEVYLFLGGEGKMALGDDVVDVSAGTAIRVAPDTMMAVHANADSPTDLRFVCVRSGPATLADVGNDADFSHDPFPWA